jgi:type IV pilus assembly protein PilV
MIIWGPILIVASNNMIRHQRGFTLIEALITFVILSIGLLGIVSLLGLAKTSQHQAIQRTRAVGLADAMVERIRINPAGLAIYIGSNPLGGNNGGTATISDEPTPDCRDTVCTPVELAEHDLWAWEQALLGAMATVTEGTDTLNTAGIIEARGCVRFIAAPGMARTGLLNVAIQWRGLLESTDAVQGGEFTCGGAGASEDDYRRQVVVNTVVIDETEL